jgi:hypothetical protein
VKTVFQFSAEIAKNEGWTDLFKWLSHFEQTGMPAGLVVNDTVVSVWRAGERVASVSTAPKVDKPKGELHYWVNNFDLIWRQLGGKVLPDNLRRVQIYGNGKKN